MTRVEWRPCGALRILVFVGVLALPHLSYSQVTVMGRVVVGETGRSLEGATVILERKDGEGGEVQRAQTNDEGRFEWEGVAAGEYVVRIQAEGYAERTRQFSVAGEDVHLALSVIGTPDLRGRVLGPDGQPFVRTEVSLRAEIRATPTSWQVSRISQTVSTDEDGRFLLRASEFGRWELAAVAKDIGYAVAAPFTVRQGEVPPELTLELKPASTISGRVVLENTDEAVAGARVGCYAREHITSSLRRAMDETGADGTFTVSDLPPGEYWLSVSAEGLQPGHSQITVGEGEHVEDLIIKLARGITVTGQALAPDGQTPLANAKVVSNQGRSTETDAEGRFVVANLLPGTCRLQVIAEGFAPVKHSFEVAEGEEPPELRILAGWRGGTITGRAIDVDANKPLAGEVVAALEPEEHGRSPVPHYVDDGLAHLGRWLPEGSPFRTKTDADGRYELNHISPGSYVVVLIRERGLALWQTDVQVREGETRAGVDFEVRRRMPGVLAVRVVLPDGKPLANGSVLTEIEHPNGSGGRTSNTDREGYFHVRLRSPGKYAIQVTPDGYMPRVGELQVDDVNGSPELTLELEPIPPGGPPAGSISGQVLMPDGTTPAEGIFVSPFTKNAFFPGANYSSGIGDDTWRMSPSLGVATHVNGAFTIEGLLPGLYGVYASPREFGARPGTAIAPQFAHALPTMSDLAEVKDKEDTAGVRVVLGQAGSLLVTVTDAQDGTPIAQARVLHSPRDAAARLPFHHSFPHVQTDETGEARLRGLMPGTCRVRVAASGYRGSDSEGVVVEAAKETSLEVKLEPAGG